jgi:small subunit ribosomal protein S8
MQNSVIDLIIRIKNGYLAHRESIESPYSRYKEELVKKLVSLKFIKSYTVTGELKKVLIVELLYQESVPAMTDVSVFSKPGRRYYVTHKQLKPVLSGFGYSILSTSKGLLTNKEAHKEKIGGELLFNIW